MKAQSGEQANHALRDALRGLQQAIILTDLCACQTVQADPGIQTPHKKPRGGVLSDEQKAENKQLSSQRVHVEHGIRRVKGFRITRDEYRLALGLFPAVVSAVVGLLQFSKIVG